ncbi:MAG: hypothetical protein J1G01_02920 [Clostridiales bacterium]|nr:hypothetical protein [Clostridiales bacterium]
MRLGLDKIKIKRRQAIDANKKADELNKVPQCAVSVCEILSYAVLPFLFMMAGAMPSAALFILPIILCMLFLLYRRFGLYLPVSCIVGYGAAALALNYDILTVIYAVTLFFAFCGLVLSAQMQSYLACAATAAVLAIVGAMSGVAIVRLAEDKPISDIAADYVMSEYNDPVIGFFARDYYEAVNLPEGETKLHKGDDGYMLAAASKLADWAGDEFGLYVWYYCIHYGAVFAAAAFFVANAISRRTASPRDVGSDEQELKLSTRALGGVRQPITSASEMKMPRAYLWTCVLPAAITAIATEFVGGYDALTSTVMHMFVTLPSAFTFFALMSFFASLFRGRARVAAYAVLFLLGISMVLFPIVLFIGSIVGICDCILNLRFWTRYIMED